MQSFHVADELHINLIALCAFIANDTFTVRNSLCIYHSLLANISLSNDYIFKFKVSICSPHISLLQNDFQDKKEQQKMPTFYHAA